MPFYDYYCESNGQVVEAFHSGGTRLKTWKDLCEAADLDLGYSPPAQTWGHVCPPSCNHIRKKYGLDD